MVASSGPVTPTLEEIRAAPKALLHDHLDGGLRPATIVDLADAIGHALPADNADDLGKWFTAAANSGSLERYLETFVHTVAVMQTSDALYRVARECALGLAADGVAVLLAEPAIGAVRDIIDRGYVLVRGSVAASVETGGQALDEAYRTAIGVTLAVH